MEVQVQPMKPNDNLMLAIFTTVCCCLPLGIVAIVKANSVNSLYLAKQYDAANAAAEDAKKWSTIGIVVGAVAILLYIIIYAIILGGAFMMG